MVGLGNDPARFVDGDFALSRRQREGTGRTDIEKAAGGVEIDWPPTNADRAARDQVARRSNMRCRA